MALGYERVAEHLLYGDEVEQATWRTFLRRAVARHNAEQERARKG